MSSNDANVFIIHIEYLIRITLIDETLLYGRRPNGGVLYVPEVHQRRGIHREAAATSSAQPAVGPVLHCRLGVASIHAHPPANKARLPARYRYAKSRLTSNATRVQRMTCIVPATGYVHILCSLHSYSY